MQIKKNKIYQYIFLFIITTMVIFNGGVTNLFIQYNFIIISILFLLLIKEKNYLALTKQIFLKNKIAIYLYFLFIGFLIFQTIPLPIGWLNFLSPEKYNFLGRLEFNGNFNTISWNSVNSYFGILNYLSLFLYLIIFKCLFYKVSDILKLYYFLAFLGAFAASVALYFYLIGNPDFLIFKNSSYIYSATGFFVNRTVFACFLVLCFFCGIEYLKINDQYQKDSTSNFFKKIYTRIFLLLITIGIITSFSRLGNFLFISLIIIHILQTLYLNERKSRFFLVTLLFIVLFDILILGFYFGSEKLLDRYSFLKNELNAYLPSTVQNELTRGNLSKFAFIEFKKFALFGYGEGGFESLFKIDFQNMSNAYALNAHSDLREFIGEFGLIGSTLVILCILFIHIKNSILSFKNFILYYFLITILIFDFSFHVPIIQFLFIILLSINYKKNSRFN